jgi:hypothetical protein
MTTKDEIQELLHMVSSEDDVTSSVTSSIPSSVTSWKENVLKFNMTPES